MVYRDGHIVVQLREDVRVVVVAPEYQRGRGVISPHGGSAAPGKSRDPLHGVDPLQLFHGEAGGLRGAFEKLADPIRRLAGLYLNDGIRLVRVPDAGLYDQLGKGVYVPELAFHQLSVLAAHLPPCTAQIGHAHAAVFDLSPLLKHHGIPG